MHWNSVDPDGNVPDHLLRTLLDHSYTLVLEGFSKKKQREILGLSCCGTDCHSCKFYNNPCAGCNEACGKPFHTPLQQTCVIYGCCVKKNRFSTCRFCKQLPCSIWFSVRDPSITDLEFRQNIADRIATLKSW